MVKKLLCECDTCKKEFLIDINKLKIFVIDYDIETYCKECTKKAKEGLNG